MMYDLFPCPHCEGKAKMKTGLIKIDGQPRRCAWVVCQKCMCRTNYFQRSEYPDYMDMAAAAWNMRVEDWYDDEL